MHSNEDPEQPKINKQMLKKKYWEVDWKIMNFGASLTLAVHASFVAMGKLLIQLPCVCNEANNTVPIS